MKELKSEDGRTCDGSKSVKGWARSCGCIRAFLDPFSTPHVVIFQTMLRCYCEHVETIGEMLWNEFTVVCERELGKKNK